jgi:hypothetical protein
VADGGGQFNVIEAGAREKEVMTTKPKFVDDSPVAGKPSCFPPYLSKRAAPVRPRASLQCAFPQKLEIKGRFISTLAGPISVIFAPVCSYMCRREDWAKKIVFVLVNVEINRPPIARTKNRVALDFWLLSVSKILLSIFKILR